MIIAKPYTSDESRDNYDRVFAKKTAAEWLQFSEFKGIVLMDPDGWRSDNTPLDTPIKYSEFCRRLSHSTCMCKS